MSGTTRIQWTAADDGTPGMTLNPVVGCDHESDGCDHCYAATLHNRRYLAWKRGAWPTAPAQYHTPFWHGAGHVQLLPDRLETPFRWHKPKRVFVNSMSDLFHEDVPDWFIARTWAMMALTPQHTYQILTKRPQRMLRWFGSDPYGAVLLQAKVFRAKRRHLGDVPISNPARFPLPNVWLGVSVEHQQAADERIPILMDTPAAIRFLSCEPLLGPLTIERYLWKARPYAPAWGRDSWATVPDNRQLDWVIIGGESGPHARPMDLAWAESLVAQCRHPMIAPYTAVFVKQLGSVWAKAHGPYDPHGGTMEVWPEALRIRQYPQTREALKEARHAHL